MGSKQSPVDITIDELVATLKRSSLPTVITEGGDDIVVFRQVEDEFADVGVSVLAVGGRDKLLRLYDRRGEYGNLEVAFIADRDVWVMADVADQYKDDRLLFTWGYSIENDLYHDGKLEKLLTADEKSSFKAELLEFVRWYALALNRLLGGGEERIRIHPNHLLDTPGRLAAELTLKAGETYPDELLSNIHQNYIRCVRGKSLLSLLMRQLSYPGRSVRHNHRSIMELVAANRGELLSSMYDRLAAIFR